MIRRSGFIVLASGAIVAACGRQVTPNKASLMGPPSGFMQVKFRVKAAFNFNSYSYVVVFNTNGDPTHPITPLASGSYNNYRGYSFAISVTAIGGVAGATAYIFQPPSTNPNGSPFMFSILPTQQALQFSANSNGLGTEFTVLFDRVLTQSFVTPTPSPVPSVTPTATATPTPGTTPTPTASATPTPPAIGNTWYFNYFVVQGNLSNSPTFPTTSMQDSLGTGGATDTSYSSPALNVATTFDTTIIANIPSPPPADDAANITGGELINTP